MSRVTNRLQVLKVGVVEVIGENWGDGGRGLVSGSRATRKGAVGRVSFTALVVVGQLVHQATAHDTRLGRGEAVY